MKRVPAGAGSIEERDGKFYPRLPRSHGRERLGVCDTWDEALSRLDEYCELAASGQLVPTNALGAYGKSVLEYKKTVGRRKAMNVEFNRWKNHIADRPIGKVAVENVTRADLQDWLDGLRSKKTKEPLSHQSLKHCLGLVRRVLDHAVKREIIKSNPANLVELPKAEASDGGEESKWTWLRPHELKMVLEAECLSPIQRRIIEFAFYTGFRSGEIFALRWDKIDLERGVITVARNLSEDRMVVGSTKGGKQRQIPIVAGCRRILLQQLEETGGEGPVFLSARKQNFTNGYNAGLRKALREIGITRRVRMHDLRHTFASLAAQGHVDGLEVAHLDDLQQWLGHANRTQTERYRHFSKDHLTRLVRSDPFAGPQPGPQGGQIRRTLRDSNPCPLAPESDSKTPKPPGDPGGRGPAVGQQATHILRRLASGDPSAWTDAIALLNGLATEAGEDQEATG